MVFGLTKHGRILPASRPAGQQTVCGDSWTRVGESLVYPGARIAVSAPGMLLEPLDAVVNVAVHIATPTMPARISNEGCLAAILNQPISRSLDH